MKYELRYGTKMHFVAEVVKKALLRNWPDAEVEMRLDFEDETYELEVFLQPQEPKA